MDYSEERKSHRKDKRPTWQCSRVHSYRFNSNAAFGSFFPRECFSLLPLVCSWLVPPVEREVGPSVVGSEEFKRAGDLGGPVRGHPSMPEPKSTIRSIDFNHRNCNRISPLVRVPSLDFRGTVITDFRLRQTQSGPTTSDSRANTSRARPVPSRCDRGGFFCRFFRVLHTWRWLGKHWRAMGAWDWGGRRQAAAAAAAGTGGHQAAAAKPKRCPSCGGALIQPEPLSPSRPSTAARTAPSAFEGAAPCPSPRACIWTPGTASEYTTTPP